ncbi:hypothetical protein [Paenibacillus elgii]|uniref:hypothetical protein n=1 Tax=Paenibacillus elgii TaxID=189691 RepID=UPI0020420728|nr:hypothetical protein [Paenibacillus elgii]MCM3273643.1 hypothetical protein [Paenibacillus elgii]
MKKKLVTSVLAVSMAVSAVAAPISAFAEAPAKTPPVVTFDIPGDEGSFTLVGEEKTTYDNRYINGGIAASVKIFLDVIAKRTGTTRSWTGGTTSAIAGWIAIYLSDHSYHHVSIRTGISWNSYLGYYEYVNSLVTYSDGSFTRPINVQYTGTGTRVPKDVLKAYGLPTDI